MTSKFFYQSNKLLENVSVFTLSKFDFTFNLTFLYHGSTHFYYGSTFRDKTSVSKKICTALISEPRYFNIGAEYKVLICQSVKNIRISEQLEKAKC